MREIKFRGRTLQGNWVYGLLSRTDEHGWTISNKAGKPFAYKIRPETIGQYTGLKDKNGDKEVYEYDIIDSDGNVIGNQHETPTLLEEKTNILVQGFGTKDWFATYTQAVERGCHDA